MALEKKALQVLNFYAPLFELEIEGKKLDPIISKSFIDVKVDEKINEGASFNITLSDEFDRNTQEFKWIDHPLFTVGNKVNIKMGYSGTLKALMIGRITSLEPSFFSGETPSIIIGGQDLSYDYIKRKSPERTFKDKLYSEIAEKIAKEAGLNVVVDKTSQSAPVIRKNNNESYFAFIERLARKVGYQFKIDRQTMYFIKPEDQKGEILTLELGKDLISFSPKLKTTKLYSEVEVRGHNPADPNTPIIGRAKGGSERPQESPKKTGSQIAKERHGEQKKVITNVIVTSVEHANALALAELNKASDSLIVGDAEFIGLPDIRPGVAIRFEKMGKRFSGKYYVTGATHTINSSGYRTRFSVKRNAL